MANEGTVMHIETDDEGRFKMCFIAFGFAPLLIIDGAHLKGTYIGTNLVLVGMDGNNQIVPIATSVSQGEIRESWTWFLLKFKECIGMMNCKMKSDKLQEIYWKTCKAYTPEEFQRRVSDLHGFRPEAYKKLKVAGFEIWSRAMCLADRYIYMTSNSAESINNLTRHVRKVPIMQLMEWYRSLLQKWYCARRDKYKDSDANTLSDWATHKVMDRMQKSAHWKHTTNNYVGQQEYEVHYTNNYVSTQEYKAAYNNMNGSSHGYEAAYTNFNSMFEQANINFGGQSQHPLPTMWST
ncbi:transposase, MuDR, MULE transposase domain protein [Tanacetum coccineum]